MSARQPVLALQPEAYFQVAAVGYREVRCGLEFLLVRTRSGRWTFPKGHVEPTLGARRSAQREALEEAGAYGVIETLPFAAYRAMKNSSRFQGPAEFLVYAYLLRITHQSEPLEVEREPVWVTAETGHRMLRWDRAEPYATQIANMLELACATIAGAERTTAVSALRPPKAGGNLYEIS